MKTYSITITLGDGSQDRCYGLFTDAFACLMAVMDVFPGAKRISARRLP
jgi:hypothetical protein